MLFYGVPGMETSTRAEVAELSIEGGRPLKDTVLPRAMRMAEQVRACPRSSPRRQPAWSMIAAGKLAPKREWQASR